MAEKKQPILGLDLNISDDYLAECVKQAVVVGIAESLNGKGEITSHIVNAVLSTKVDRHGKVSGWSSDNNQTLLEYYVNELVREAAQEEIAAQVEEMKPTIRQAVKEELSKHSTSESLAEQFVANLVQNCSRWYPRLEVKFEKED